MTNLQGWTVGSSPKAQCRSSFSFRGQLTVEALLLGALALSLLIIAALAITRLQAAQADVFTRHTLQVELEGLGQYADEICVLGIGNARTMALAPAMAGGKGALNLTTTEDGRTLLVHQGSWSISRLTICPVGVDDGAYGSTAYLWYEAQADGGPGVRISPTPPSLSDSAAATGAGGTDGQNAP